MKPTHKTTIKLMGTLFRAYVLIYPSNKPYVLYFCQKTFHVLHFSSMSCRDEPLKFHGSILNNMRRVIKPDSVLKIDRCIQGSVPKLFFVAVECFSKKKAMHFSFYSKTLHVFPFFAVCSGDPGLKMHVWIMQDMISVFKL